MSFITEQIELSRYSTADPSSKLKANVYKMEGVTDEMGNPRLMSVGQLVMAICMRRAADLERDIIDLMETINTNTALLQGLTEVEATLVEATSTVNANSLRLTVAGEEYTYYNFVNTVAKVDVSSYGTSWDTTEIESIITALEARTDSLNTISQEPLIDLQSLTAKRDQTYDMVSNVLKSLYTQMMGNLNNL
jgi:hypothetical protein